MEKSIIIVGAGMAGLSAGCYSQMNGYRTQIFEMHTTPGGVCTTWKRRGYKIDGCIHWLTGTKSGTDFFPIWEELGVMQRCSMIEHEEYARIEGKDGKVFIVYCDINRLDQHMKELAPEDKDVIEEFTNGIRKMTHFPIPWEKAPELYSPMDRLRIMRKMLPYMEFWRKWGEITIQDVAQRFKNPFMHEAFPFIFNLENPPDFPIMAVMKTFAWMDQKTASYPAGGSLELARTVEKRYLDLGGEIHYKSRVVKILVENDRAVGVKLADGSEHRSDIVISAADGHTTIFNMLNGKYINGKIRGYYDKLTLFSPLIYVGLGVARSFEEIPHTVTGIDFPFDEPVVIGEKERSRLSVQFYAFDPTLAPAGKTFVRVHFASDYDYWKKLKQGPERYEEEKEQIADKVVALLDRRFPGLAAKVEMRDVATPLTWVRYTGNWRGSFQGWIETTNTLRLRMSQNLPGLKNFYMAGQWVQPGGSLPSVAMSGRNVTQIICKYDKKPFTTTVPN
ncbi:MAG: NAD(P)/FAD-dependent oxidoreductase [Spirochaetota bacterium]|nr:MAG: NAD(P)/FAD-dependent oxidoreductase [Spirochaetota bacterium]